MPPKKRGAVCCVADRAKERDRKRKDRHEKEEKAAVAHAIEEERVRAEKEKLKFKEGIVLYPYDLRVEAAAHAYRCGTNKFTQAELADRHVVGQTSLKAKIKDLKKKHAKDLQDAMLSGVVASEVVVRECTLNLEADNEAHLAFLATRAQVQKDVHEKQQQVAELKAKRTSVRKEKRNVRCLFIRFRFRDFHFFAEKRNRC